MSSIEIFLLPEERGVVKVELNPSLRMNAASLLLRMYASATSKKETATQRCKALSNGSLRHTGRYTSRLEKATKASLSLSLVLL